MNTPIVAAIVNLWETSVLSTAAKLANHWFIGGSTRAAGPGYRTAGTARAVILQRATRRQRKRRTPKMDARRTQPKFNAAFYMPAPDPACFISKSNHEILLS